MNREVIRGLAKKTDWPRYTEEETRDLRAGRTQYSLRGL